MIHLNNTQGIILSPSIASANQLCLRDEVAKTEAAGCTDLHIDIEDGNFIPNITFGIKTVRALRSISALPFSVHLMVTNPMAWIPQFTGLGVQVVFAHWEALPYPREFIGLAHALGFRAGIALNPRTLPDHLCYLGDDLEDVLLLTCEPDGKGELFLPPVLDRAKQLRQVFPKANIWVDGAITEERFPALASCGVTHAVVGRAFFSPDMRM